MSRKAMSGGPFGAALVVLVFAVSGHAQHIQARPYDVIKTRTGTIKCRIVIDQTGEKVIWVEMAGSNIKRPIRRADIIEILRRQSLQEAYEEATRKAAGDLNLRYEIFRECIDDHRIFKCALKEAERMGREAPLSALAKRAKVEALLQLDDIEEAGETARSILKSDTRDLELIRICAKALMEAGDFDAAADAYRKALKAAPNEPKSLVGLGWALLETGDLAGAEGSFKAALEKEATLYAAVLGMSYLHLAKGELETAGENFIRAKALVKDFWRGGRDIRPLLGLGAVAYLDGRTSDAKTLFQEALNLRPNSPLAFYDLALVFAAEGRMKEAHEYLRYANTPDAPMGRAYVGIAHLLDAAGSTVAALEQARDGAKAAPKDPYCLYMAGYLEYRSGDVERAAVYFGKAAEVAPEAEEALLALASARAVQGETEEASELYRKALKKWPGAESRAGLGLALAASNRLEEAGAELSAALAEASSGSSARLNALLGLGYIANLKSLRDGSKRYFLLALTEQGDSKYALDALSQLYEQEGKRIDFFGFDEGEAPAGWQVQAPYGVSATFQEGRVVLEGTQARSDGGQTSAMVPVTQGVFEAAACDIYVDAAAGQWEGGMMLIAGGVRLVAARNTEGSLAWRYRDERRGWREWSAVGQFPESGKVHIELKTATALLGRRSVPGIAIFADGRECGRAPVGPSLTKGGVRIGVYTSALIGRAVHMEADNLFVVARGGSIR